MEMHNTSEGEHNQSPAPPKSTSLKSLPKYELKYQRFRSWLQEKNTGITEEILMDYFHEKKASLKSQSSYWGEYSALKSTILIFDEIDISQFKRVLEFVKMQKTDERPRTSKAFSREEINKFLLEAPDDEYLLLKVAMIIGIAGGCRRDELTMMTTDDILDQGSAMIVNMRGNNQRIFSIVDVPDNDVQYLPYVRRYLELRPENATTRRLFCAMRKGVFVDQAVGMNTVAQYPSKIAKYLDLENPRGYTGQAFRRTYTVLCEQKRKDDVL